MKKLATLFLALGLALVLTAPAQARVFVTAYFGPGYYPYYPGYVYGYPGYYPGYYIVPPPVIYAPPAPTVATATYAGVAAAAGTLPANQTSPTYVDALGRTCRHFVTANGIGPAYGTACLMPDGTWHAVP
jgi:hypothetical protein